MKINKSVFPILVLAALVSCSSETATTVSNCRKHATAYTSSGTSFACTWSSTTLKFVCTGGGVTNTYTYPSLSKFVDETDYAGRISYSTYISSNATDQTSVANSFDSAGKLISIVQTATVSGATTSFTYTFSTHDTAGRPVTGTRTLSSGCTNQNVGWSYNDTSKTISETYTGGTSCTDSSATTTFDAATGLAASQLQGTTTSFTRTGITASPDVCQ